MNLQTWLNKISLSLATIVANVKITNKNGYFQLNKLAENLFLPIFEILFDTKFTNVNVSERPNYPAIDLSSKEKRISIQITSEKEIEKVKDTITQFLSEKEKLYTQYDILFHFIITEKQNSYSQDSIDNTINEEIKRLSNPPKEFSFDVKKQIIDQGDLFGMIENAGAKKIKEIHDHLELAFGNPIELFSHVNVLIPYKEFFSSQLDSSTSELQYQFHNPFFGREDILGSLKKFIDAPFQKVIAIVADGGFGKTRLCIEFFKREIDPRENHTAYVLNPVNFQCLELSEEISAEENLVLLFDDAHKHPKVLAEIKRFVEKRSKLKLIVTIRESMLEDTIRDLPTTERNIHKINLVKLSYNETQELFKSQLPGLKTEHIKSLADQSRGIPLVILSICQVLRSGKSNEELSEDDFFKEFVREHIGQIIEEIHQRTHINMDSIARLVQTISLISPIIYNDYEMKLLCELSGCTLSDVYMVVDQLGRSKLLEMGNSFSIKPDPYSDVILIDSLSRIKPILSGDKNTIVIDRIIKNLSSIENSARSDINLDNLLYDFISDIKKPDISKERLTNIFDTVLSISYKKPLIALHAVRNYLDILQNQDHPLHKERSFFQRYERTVIEGYFEKIDEILSIIFINIHGYNDISDAFETLLQYAIKRNDTLPLKTCFRYREYDFYDYSYRPLEICERQQFLIQKMEETDLNVADTFQLKVILDLCRIFLVTEFEIHTYFDKYTNQFTFGHAPVPVNDITRDLRMRCLKLLVKLYEYERTRSI
jgi:hypothetical protein